MKSTNFLTLKTLLIVFSILSSTHAFGRDDMIQLLTLERDHYQKHFGIENLSTEALSEIKARLLRLADHYTVEELFEDPVLLATYLLDHELQCLPIPKNNIYRDEIVAACIYAEYRRQLSAKNFISEDEILLFSKDQFNKEIQFLLTSNTYDKSPVFVKFR